MEEQLKKNGSSTGPAVNFRGIWRAIKKHRTLYYKVLPTTLVVVYLIMMGYPEYYKCRVKLAPESASSNNSGSLASLASSFGLSIGNGVSAGSDAITPLLYPDLMKSTDFTTSLFDIKVQRDSDKQAMTYYEYLRDYQKSAWWTGAKKAFFGLIFGSGKGKSGKQDVSPFRLTPEQDGINSAIRRNIYCNVDKKSLVITIEVTDQDPVVCATVADSVRKRLQVAMTDYRTTKARHDLEYIKHLHQESKKNYDRACSLYAEFMDSNQEVVLESVRQKQTRLENEMQLRYNNYNALSAQLLSAMARVQQDTPAFAPLECATVPLGKEGPHRGRTAIAFVFIAFMAITLWVMYKEGEMKSLFKGLN